MNCPADSIVARNGRLHVSEGRLLNEHGEPVRLCGMSTHNIAWNPETYCRESLTVLVKEWHITVFRIAVYTHEWGGYCWEEWKSKDEYISTILGIADICTDLGVYCIIDWHILNEGSGDPNKHIKEASEFFLKISSKLFGHNNIIYDICNEPNGVEVSWARIKEYAEQIVPVIRKNDFNSLILCGTPNWSQDVDEAAISPLRFENVMYSLHFYAGTHGESLRKKADVAIKKGIAIFVSEFGLSKADGNGGVFEKECNQWMAWMEVNNLSWVNWSYSDVDESSAALIHGAVKKRDWNTVSPSGEYIKAHLYTNYKNHKSV